MILPVRGQMQFPKVNVALVLGQQRIKVGNKIHPFEIRRSQIFHGKQKMIETAVAGSGILLVGA